MAWRKYASVLLLIFMWATAGWMNAQGMGKSAGQSLKKGAAAGDANLQAALEKLERAGWEAYKKKDKKAFAALVTDDYTAGLADGQGGHNRQGTISADLRSRWV